jgi:HlyD family secretion protein
MVLPISQWRKFGGAMMRWASRLWPLGLNGTVVLVAALSSLAYGSYALETWPFNDRRPLVERYRFVRVSRGDLVPTVVAPGQLDSSRKTIVKCELENTAGGTQGGSSVILTLLPEGTPVKTGDVLARLDASTYDEMYRQQAITVEQAKASHLQAELNLEIARLAVREYRDGTVHETLKGMEGAIALARSDLSRATERMNWTKRMNEKGYASLAQIASDQDTVSRMQIALDRQLASLDLFKRFTEPKTLKTLQGDVKAAETVLGNETLRLQRQLERHAMLKKQVDRCTIRAPQDGVLFYYKGTDRRRTVLIEEGETVRQNQELFFLPDMRAMEVVTALNESVVDRVRVGLPAKVSFEALPNLTLCGHVATISQIPVRQSERGEDIRFFISTIKLDETAPQLKPGMTTLVEIALTRQDDVLALPHQAIRSDHGKKYCYVANDEELQRREVKIGHDTCDLVEVLAGVNEGELVALDPPKLTTYVEPLLNFDDSGSVRSQRDLRSASIR